MKKIALMCVMALSLSVSGCDSLGGPKQTIGTGVGALGGGLLGSQIGSGTGRLWATGAGVLLGGLVGSSIGKSLDEADKAAASHAQEKAYTAPVGEPIAWNNPKSGNSGTVVAVRDGTSSSGRYCREYQQTIVVGGQKQTGYGTACQQPDGSWEIVK
jgi:surface antigen